MIKYDMAGVEMKKIFYPAWAVAYKIDASTQDDEKEKTEVIALFTAPVDAEDFINKCLPAQTRERFFIVLIEEV